MAMFFLKERRKRSANSLSHSPRLQVQISAGARCVVQGDNRDHVSGPSSDLWPLSSAIRNSPGLLNGHWLRFPCVCLCVYQQAVTLQLFSAQLDLCRMTFTDDWHVYCITYCLVAFLPVSTIRQLVMSNIDFFLNYIVYISIYNIYSILSNS